MLYKRTKEDYEQAVLVSTSIAGVARELGILPKGGNYNTIKKAIARYDLDCSHFLGQAHNTANFKSSSVTPRSIKNRLIHERGHRCEKCNRDEWLGLPITIELEHKDGNTQNNEESNLELLCPNCHSQTKTWKRKKSSFGDNPRQRCPDCGGKKMVESSLCAGCEYTRRKGVPHKRAISLTREELVSLVESSSAGQVAVQLGVSKTTVLRYMKKDD